MCNVLCIMHCDAVRMQLIVTNPMYILPLIILYFQKTYHHRYHGLTQYYPVLDDISDG